MSTTAADDRRTRYNPVVATTDFAADFPVFDNDDLKVFVDGVERDDFAVTATYVEGISTDAKAVFAVGVIGVVDVVGYRDPHRTNRFVDGAPLPPRNINLALDTLEGESQEARRDIERAAKVKFGETAYEFDPGLSDGQVLMKSGTQLVAGPDAALIVQAEGFATAAQASAVAADLSADEAAASLAQLMTITTSAMYASATKIYYAAQMGVHPDVDLAADFDGFLQFAWNNAGRAEFGVGDYLVSQTGKIRTLSRIMGQGNAGVHDDGTIKRGGTVFKATVALRTSGAAVLETLDFAANSGTEVKLITEPTMTWGFHLRDFTIDRGWSQNFADAAADVLKGRGLNIYGRRYKAQHIGVYNSEGVAFYTECGSPASPPAGWYYDYRNNQDGVIEDIDIQFSAYEGFVTFGPGDSYINRITVGLCGDARATVHPMGTPLNSLMFPGDRITNFVMAAADISGASGTHELGVIHAHTNWNGWAFRALGGATRLVRLKAENLIAEGALGSVFLQTGVYAQISKINTRNNNVKSTTPSDLQFADVRLASNFEVDIASIECRKKAPFVVGQDPGLTGVRIEQDDVQIGNIKHEGNTVGGHAVTVESSKKHIYIASIWASNSRGNAQDGQKSAAFYSKAGIDDVVVGNLMSPLSDYGWRNASTGKVAVLSGHAEVSSAALDITGVATNVAGIQLDATPANQHIRKSKLTSTTLAGTLLKPDCNQIVTAATAGIANPAIVQSNIPLTIAHGLWRIPDYQREGRASVQFNGTKPTTAPSIEPTGADATNMTFNYNQPATAAGATSGGTVVRLEI